MAREKVDRGDIFDRASMSRKGGAASANLEQDDNQDFMTRRMANFEIEVPDSHVLLAILNRKGKYVIVTCDHKQRRRQRGLYPHLLGI